MAAALFKKLRAIYLQKWVDQFPSAEDVALAQKEWAEAIDGLSNDQLKSAIEFCKSNLDWPPSIAAFRKAAIESSANRAMFRRNAEALALPKTTWQERREAGAIEINKIKRQLK